ncbi:endolytic transglycosylase MltG [Candidatus Marinimicrobia bacterium]|nr:endolytic transglycosylase MltG [Candidatus Neomarinimicrobiota bacterium]|tara:strand:+ start:846 stop:1904 length:1059 start_codon:yes stop_codon:yes gene_type:complete
MLDIKQFNPGIKTVGSIAGIVIASILAFYLLVIYWPQSNPYERVEINIPRGVTLSKIGDILKERNIISNKRTFTMAVKSLGHEKNIPAGRYILHNALNNRTIINQLVYGVPSLKRITVLEGWTIDEIANELEAKLKINKKSFLSLCHNKRMIRLFNLEGNSFEGYLFPDTYSFAEGIDPYLVLTRMVNEFKNNISKSMEVQAQELGLSILEVITLASIIEGEAIYDSERSIISAVYHNRLKKGMKLQADPTIQYIIDDGPRRLLNHDLKIKSNYNTYLYKGLPPGPINNPGKESIIAALYPSVNEFLYFVAKGDGYHTFTKNEKDHNKAKRKFQEVRRRVNRLKNKIESEGK